MKLWDFANPETVSFGIKPRDQAQLAAAKDCSNWGRGRQDWAIDLDGVRKQYKNFYPGIKKGAEVKHDTTPRYEPSERGRRPEAPVENSEQFTKLKTSMSSLIKITSPRERKAFDNLFVDLIALCRSQATE